MLKTRRIRRLLSKFKPFLESECPWTTQSYPSRSISTLRGQFTVHTHRDGTVVNLPCSLIVQGDVIELYKDVPLPANATVLDSEGVATDTHVTMGCFPPLELFKRQTSGVNIRVVEEEKRVRFIVTQTPIITKFMTTIQKKRAVSVLTREKAYVLFVMNILCLITLGVSLLWNVIRYSVLRDDVGHWTEMLLQLQVYTVLPLLQLLFPLLWTLMNLYGTARIVLLTEKVIECTPSGSFRSRFQNTCNVLKKMLVLLVSPSMYPNYRVFHILGSLTSLCSIDKEYVLTDSAPVPEKVFFLTRRQLEDDLPQGEQSVKRKAPVVTMAEEGGTKVMVREASAWEAQEEGVKEGENALKGRGFRNRLEVCVEVNVETASVGADGLRVEEPDDKMTKSLELERSDKFPTSELVRADSDSAMLPSVSHQNTSTATSVVVPTDRNKVDPSGNEGEVLNKPNHKKVPRRFLSQDSTTLSEQSQSNRLSQALTGSAQSLLSQFELVGEILDLSPNHDTTSGLGFDDVNWEGFLGSLKPIGLSCLATSHFLRDPYSWSPSGCSEYVRRNLCKTNCVCPLGIEIGVNEFLRGNFTKEVLLFSVSDQSQSENIASFIRRPSASILTENVIQPHLLSSVLKDKSSGHHLIMSRGSGDMVASCCSDFWDGKDLQPMTDIERSEVETFFARRHLTSYCVTLAYNPLVDIDLSSLLQQNIALYVPKKVIYNSYESCHKDYLHGQPVSSFTGEQLFSNLLCHQVFLGVVSLQFQPRTDIVHLIEDLELTGIRFVYFTNENEVRGKVFAEKLGLEAGWNCHISLALGSEDPCSTHDDEHEFESCSTSTSSSLNSVINAFQSYVRAKLPKGVHNVRPHLKNVDNVPLLVPLFTDCTVDAIQEMIEIMQENGEVVMCLGNAWNHDNLSIYAQADVSLSIIPECASLQCCLDAKSGDATLSTSVSDNNFGNPPQQSDPRCLVWPTPLEMATYLNTAMCQLCIHRQNDISVLNAVTESRHIMSCVRRGLLFGVGSSMSITVLMLATTIFFLPPPLSPGHIFMFLLFSIPLLALSFLSSPFDPKIKTQMPTRKKKVLNEKLLLITHFCTTFLPSVIILLLLFSLALLSVCERENSTNSDCHPLLGDRNESSLWNGWRGANEQGLLLAQDVTALFFSLHLVTHSVRFIHRTAPIWRLYRHLSWLYVTSTCLVIALQIVYFAISQSVSKTAPLTTHRLSAVPSYVWVMGILSCAILVLVHELLKYRDRKQVLKLQRHLKLEFETKLGMNSPF